MSILSLSWYLNSPQNLFKSRCFKKTKMTTISSPFCPFDYHKTVIYFHSMSNNSRLFSCLVLFPLIFISKTKSHRKTLSKRGEAKNSVLNHFDYQNKSNRFLFVYVRVPGFGNDLTCFFQTFLPDPKSVVEFLYKKRPEWNFHSEAWYGYFNHIVAVDKKNGRMKEIESHLFWTCISNFMRIILVKPIIF